MNLEFAVVCAKGPRNYSAYVPDLPGCVFTASTWEELQEIAARAIEFHIEGMLENGDPVPEAPMTCKEALDHHIRILEEQPDPAQRSPTAVSTVAVNLAAPKTIQAS